MEKDLYLTEVPPSQSLDAAIVPQKERSNILVKSLSNPNDRRNQLSKKVLSNFPLESYYDDKKIKPGISLFKVILDTEERRKDGSFNGPYLRLNIQPTVAFTDNVNTMIKSEQGIIKTQNYILYENYLTEVKITDKNIRNQPKIKPTIIIKSCNGIVFENEIIMNNQITPKIIPKSENVISTKFILPYASYPNIIRLFFIPKNVKNLKKNFAYKVINRKQMTEEIFKKKYRMASQFMVNIDNEDSYIVTLMKGKALQFCQKMTDSLCEYLQNGLLIQIFQIVVDFIVDDQKTIYFNEIKCIKSKCKTKLWEIGTNQQIIKLASENNNQIMCRLCSMLYSKNQMDKLVTNKLIYELVSHLENRGKNLGNIPQIKKQGLSNVCHLCYELIKAQHTLINVERQLSKLMNIRHGDIQRFQTKEYKQKQSFFYDEEQFQKSGEQSSTFKKWRLFFYFQNLKKIPKISMPEAQVIEITLDMKFQNQKQRFVKKVKNYQNCPANLDINFNKNWNKSNRHHERKSSFLSKKQTIRVQSAIPERQVLRQSSTKLQSDKNNESTIQPPFKNKSSYNDQTTCITHSQSYFSSLPNQKSQSEYNNSTTLNHYLEYNASRQNGFNNSCIQQDFQESFEKSKQVFNKRCGNLRKEGSAVGETVKVEKVKMFTFYTKAREYELNNVLADEELQFNLTFTPLSTSLHIKTQTIKFSGASSTLNCLKNKQACQRHSLEIYLFDNEMKFCNLQLTVGMVCDGVYDGEGLQLEKCKNLFWGKNYSCQPLPDEWMQVFTNGQEVPKGNMQKLLSTLEQNNFLTQPILMENIKSVNYLKQFQQSAQSSINPFAINNLQARLFSGISSSQSAVTLKKMSLVRCKTAINRNNGSFETLSSQNRKSKGTNSNRGTNQYSKRNRKSILQSIDSEDQENKFRDFGV